MNLKKSSLNTTAVLILVSAFLLLAGSPVYSGDSCQIIRVEEGKGGGGTRLEIFPEKVTVPVGTCTVWINFAQRKEVRVSFRDNAKACMLSSEAAQGFDELELKDGESCYISEKLPRGKTASLVWSKPGVYKYQLEASGATTTTGYTGTIMAEGIIEVK